METVRVSIGLAAVGFFVLTTAGPTSSEEAAVASPSVAVPRAQLTTAVLDREPQDSVDRVSAEVSELSYFSELSGLEGHTVSHVWEHQGEEVARVSFEVGGDRWRVHSTKRLDPRWTGAWRVVVVDQSGAELRSDPFYYAAEESAASPPGANEPPSEAPPAAPAPASE